MRVSTAVRLASPSTSTGHAAGDATSRLTEAFDRCADLLDTSGPPAALAGLVRDAAACRAAAAPDEWRAAARRLSEHRLHARLREDPYIAAAVEKARGFAGDAHTIDFVYRYRGLAADASDLGREVHSVSTGAAIAEAVRARCLHLSDRLAAQLRRSPDATVVSIACGHMRELHPIPAELLVSATIVGLDQDQVALARLSALHPAAKVAPLHTTIRRIIAEPRTIPEADVVYASGLYDYLDDRAAGALTAALVRRLRPGGTLLIPNLTPANEEIGLMEAVMDWWMVYRSEDAMLQLGKHACEGISQLAYSAYGLSNGRLAVLSVSRTSGAPAGSLSGPACDR